MGREANRTYLGIRNGGDDSDKETEAPKPRGKRAGWNVVARSGPDLNKTRIQSDKVRALKLKEVYELLLTSRSNSAGGNPLFNSETIYQMNYDEILCN